MRGLLGLSTSLRPTETFASKLEEELSGSLFTETLLNQKQISKNRFSILMAFDAQQESSITFGGVPDFITSLEGAVSHRVAGIDHWMLKLMDIIVGDKTIQPKVRFALTDTGTSLIYFDELDYKAMIAGICADLECFETPYEPNVFAIKNCEPSHLPDIWVQIDLHEYKLAPQAYVVSLVYPNGSHDCLIQLRQSKKK